MLNESPDRLILPDETIEWQRGVTFFAFKTPAGKSYIAQTANSGADFFLKIGDVDISEPVKVKYREYIKIALDHESLANLIHLIKPDLIKNNTARDEFIFSGRLWKHPPNSFISFWNSKSTVDKNQELLDKFMKQNGLSFDNTLFEFPSNQGDYKLYKDITSYDISPSYMKKLQQIKHTADPRFKNLMKKAGLYETKHSDLKIKIKKLIKECQSEIINENSEIIKNDLHKIIDYSEKLQSMIKKDKDMEDWVKAKLTHAADYIDTVFDYLRFYERDEVRHVMDETWSQKAHCAAKKKRRAGKETKSKPVNETLSEESNSEMSLGDLRNINAKAKMLQKMIKPSEELEDWVKAKLNLTGEYLDDVFHHIDYHGQEGRKLDEIDWKKTLGLAAVAGSLVGSPEVSANGPVEPDKITQTAKTQTVKTPTHPYTYEDVIASTLVDEAGGEKDAERGMTAVMNVLMNRAKGNFSQVGAECLKPQQFSGWNAIDKSDIKSVKNFIDSKRTHSKFTLALEIVSKARSGELKDITGGADHFLNVALTKKQSKTSSLPSWYDSEKVTTVIGLHTFLKLNSPNKKSKK